MDSFISSTIEDRQAGNKLWCFTTRQIRKISEIFNRGRQTLIMAKQRHSSSNSGGYDSVLPDTEDRLSLDTRDSRSNHLRTIFGTVLCLITVVFTSNMFQVELFSNLFVPDSMREMSEKSNVRKPRAHCEYVDGPIFFNLKTSLGVSYDGGHWCVYRFTFCWKYFLASWV